MIRIFHVVCVFAFLASVGATVTAGESGAAPGTLDVPCANVPAGCGTIAFVSDRDGNAEIYSVHPDGTGLERLTNAAAVDDEPAWSPDGRRIAFVRSGDIHVMNADGSNVVRRTFSGFGESPAWSPDGTKIAYSTLSGGSTNVWVVSPDVGGPGPTLLFEAPGWDGQPAWSPDGTRLAVVSDWVAYDMVLDVYLIKTDGSGFEALTGNIFDFIDYVRPSWSPSGARIAVGITERIGLADYRLTVGVMNADGSGLTPLVGAGIGSAISTTNAWSPDGLRIAYTSALGATRDIAWVMADGSASGTIVANGWNPSWQR